MKRLSADVRALMVAWWAMAAGAELLGVIIELREQRRCPELRAAMDYAYGLDDHIEPRRGNVR